MRIHTLIAGLCTLCLACQTHHELFGQEPVDAGPSPVFINPAQDGGEDGSVIWEQPCEWTHTDGLDTAVVQAIAADARQVLAGTPSGLFRSSDGATNWTRVEGFPQEPVTSLAIGSDGAFAICIEDQVVTRVYRSADGLTWAPAEDGLESAAPVNRLTWTGGRLVATTGGSLSTGFEWVASTQSWKALGAPDTMSSFASNGTRQVVVVGYGAGVEYRDPGGAWTPATLPAQTGALQQVWTVGTGFALSAEDGLLLSNDGAAFTRVNLPPGETRGPVALIEVKGKLVAAFDGGIYRSADGLSWTAVGTPEDRLFARTLSLDHDALMLFAGTSEGVRRFTADATEWTNESTDLDGAQIQALQQLGAFVFASVGQDRLWISSDFGVHWSAGPVLRKNARVLSVGRAGAAIFAGTDRYGIYVTSDGFSFSPVNTGVPSYEGSAGPQLREVYGIAGDYDVQVAALSSGAIRSTDLGQHWQAANGGLPVIGHDAANQPLYPTLSGVWQGYGVFLASSASGGLFRSEDGGASWTEANDGIPLQDDGAPADIRGVVWLGSTVFAGGTRWSSGVQGVLVSSTDGGKTWTDLSSALPADTPVVDLTTNGAVIFGILAHSPVQPEDGAFFSQDGTSWRRVGGAPAVQGMSSLLVPDDKLLMGTQGSGVLALPLSQCNL